MKRRVFLKKSGPALAGVSGAMGLPLLTSCSNSDAGSDSPLSRKKWAMVIDLTRCREDCSACMTACRQENNVAFHNDQRYDVHWIRRAHLHPKEEDSGLEEKSVLLMCNQCDNPPCAMVCPVQATYKREDGIVLVDHHRCIGCRYCMIACPYNARMFNYLDNEDWPNREYPRRSHGVAESCHFCAHLIDKGERPACVEACEGVGAGAFIFGDLNDRESEVSELVREGSLKRIRDDWGTEPKVWYRGL